MIMKSSRLPLITNSFARRPQYPNKGGIDWALQGQHAAFIRHGLASGTQAADFPAGRTSVLAKVFGC